MDLIGTPGVIRTPDPLLRRQVLYPAELRAHDRWHRHSCLCPHPPVASAGMPVPLSPLCNDALDLSIRDSPPAGTGKPPQARIHGHKAKQGTITLTDVV